MFAVQTILHPTDFSDPSRCAEAHTDLIVMGTHGRTGMGRLLMGSVAEQVVRQAPCPVVTVKAPLPPAEPGSGIRESVRGALTIPHA